MSSHCRSPHSFLRRPGPEGQNRRVLCVLDEERDLSAWRLVTAFRHAGPRQPVSLCLGQAEQDTRSAAVYVLHEEMGLDGSGQAQGPLRRRSSDFLGISAGREGGSVPILILTSRFTALLDSLRQPHSASSTIATTPMAPGPQRPLGAPREGRIFPRRCRAGQSAAILNRVIGNFERNRRKQR